MSRRWSRDTRAGRPRIRPTATCAAGRRGTSRPCRCTTIRRGSSYEKLLEVFWTHVDPTDAGGQFADRGPQYRSAIFYHDDDQKRLAERVEGGARRVRRLRQADRDGDQGVHDILRRGGVSPGLLQDVLRCSTSRYRSGSGRDDFLKAMWGDGTEDAAVPKPDKETLKKTLSPLQYEVTQQCGTEPPFANEYWDNHREGIYVDVVSGEPLFSSLDKFDSRHGVAELHEAARAGQHRGEGRPEPALEAHRGAEHARRFTPRPRLSRRAEADGTALLHQLGGAAVHTEGRSRKGRLRRVPEALRSGNSRSDRRVPCPRVSPCPKQGRRDALDQIETGDGARRHGSMRTVPFSRFLAS